MGASIAFAAAHCSRVWSPFVSEHPGCLPLPSSGRLPSGFPGWTPPLVGRHEEPRTPRGLNSQHWWPAMNPIAYETIAPNVAHVAVNGAVVQVNWKCPLTGREVGQSTATMTADPSVAGRVQASVKRSIAYEIRSEEHTSELQAPC